MIRRPRSPARVRPVEASPLAAIQKDLEHSDPTLARSLARLDDSRLLPWWTRPAVWWLGAPVAIGAFFLAVRGAGLVAFIGLAPLLLLSGLALVATTLPADPDRGDHGAVDDVIGPPRRRRRRRRGAR